MGQAEDNTIPPTPRLLGLDILRLVAVVLVLGRHMPPPPESWPLIGRLPFLAWNRGGWVGVDLFFVLSGFLVAGLLFTEYKSLCRLGIGRFYMRRGWKIYPPFFTLILATVALKVFRGRQIPSAALASEALFIQSYVPGLWNHTWSLAVEEHFYILLPVVLALILRWNRNAPLPLQPILFVAAIVAVLTLAMRLLNWYLRPSYDHLTHLFPSHLRLDSLLCGVAISYLYHFHSDSFVRRLTPWRRTLIGCGALLLAPAFVVPLESTAFSYTIGFSIFYIGSGMMLVGILLSRIRPHRAIAFLATLGAFSYSIYLWHMPVLDWGIPLVERLSGLTLNYGIRLGLYFVGSFCVGIIMSKAVEAPVLRLRDRWFPSRSPGAIQVQAKQTPHALAYRSRRHGQAAHTHDLHKG